MPRKPRETVPTSVILPAACKAYIKAVGEKEQRTFSHQVRWIILQWWEDRKTKERSSGEKGQKGEEVGQAGG